MAHVLPLIADAESTEKTHLRSSQWTETVYYLTVERKSNNHLRAIPAKCYRPFLCNHNAIRGDLFMFDMKHVNGAIICYASVKWLLITEAWAYGIIISVKFSLWNS